MTPKEAPPCAIGEFHVDQEEGLTRGANLGLYRHAAEAVTQLTNEGQIGAVGPGGLDQQLNTLLIHLEEWPKCLLNRSIDLFSRFWRPGR
jgi:hypothetical protein